MNLDTTSLHYIHIYYIWPYCSHFTVNNKAIYNITSPPIILPFKYFFSATDLSSLFFQHTGIL